MADAVISTRRALAVALLASCVALLAGAADPAASQPSTVTPVSAPLARQSAVVAVPPATAGTGAQPPDTTTTTTTTPAGGATEDPATTEGASVGQDIRADPGYGNAAQQPAAAKQKEAAQDCVGTRPPISKMLGVGGVVAGDDGTSWNGLVLILAVVSLLVAITAYLIRSHRSPSGMRSPRGALEIISTMLAIVGGVVGLAVQFIPGIGITDEPAPTAAMTVRDVQARITRGEYARKTGVSGLRRIDQRQVGNVIWLEISLEGYSGKHAALQYAMYDPRAGGALLPGTAKSVPLQIENRDSQQSFVPIWVGYPKSQKFSAQFRLLVGSPPEVRQIADTGAMHGSQFRYSC